MQSAKRMAAVEPVENVGGQVGHRSAQRKIPRLKSFDARVEKREPLPVQLYLANLDEPRGSRTYRHGRRQSPWCSRTHQTILAVRRSTAAYSLIGEFPKHAYVVYCAPQPDGGYCLGVKFEGPAFKWHV